MRLKFSAFNKNGWKVPKVFLNGEQQHGTEQTFQKTKLIPHIFWTGPQDTNRSNRIVCHLHKAHLSLRSTRSVVVLNSTKSRVQQVCVKFTKRSAFLFTIVPTVLHLGSTKVCHLAMEFLCSLSEFKRTFKIKCCTWLNCGIETPDR